MRKLLTAALAAGMALALAAPARAQDEEPVYKKISPRQMEKILRELGFEFEKVSEPGDKVQRWRFTMDGFRVLLLSDGTDMQLYAGFDAKMSPQRMNEWNRSKRFNRAYITKDKGVALESDLDFAGGVTTGQVKKFIGLYRQVLKAFKKFLDEDE
jgi:hypothetical protein